MNKKADIFNKKNYISFAIIILWWAITFITDFKIFTHDELAMSSLPIDRSMVPFMHIASKLLELFAMAGIITFLRRALANKKDLIIFGSLFALYIILLLINYPGYYMSDDTLIFGYATRYYPVYWHNYLTSLYYMVGMSMFPASTGPIILNDFILAAVFTFIISKTLQVSQAKAKYAVFILPILPFVLLSSQMVFRPALYAPAFLFFFAYLFFEKKEKKTLTYQKLAMLSALCAVLCFWRSEGIVLVVFCIFLIPLCYGFNAKKLGLFFLSFIIVFGLIKVPQSVGEKKYYGSDYLIISTVRPLSLIIHREQTYPEAEQDWDNINEIIDLGYLSYETLSCSSYNRFNSDYNSGHFTETGADKETQSAYLKSAARLILHNLDLYAAERLQLFAVTNGFYNYNPDMVMGWEPVTTSEFLSFQGDRDYGYELVKGNARWHYESSQAVIMFLFRFGGEAYIPILLLAVVCTIYTLIRKKWFFFFAFLSLIAREAVIFMTAPASFIQYSYPVMFVTVFLLLMMCIFSFENGLFRTISDRKSKVS